MNENLDLIKILKGCPEGTKFYSTIYGDVCFIRISYSSSYPIELLGCTNTFKRSIDVYTTKEGLDKHNFNGECILFPSKDQRDWSKFERFWDKPKVEKFDPKTLQPYDRVLVRDATSRRWKIDFYGYNINPYVGLIDCASGSKPYCIPYNDDTKNLLGTTDDCPEYYKWWKGWK